MCVLLITRLLRGVGRWARKPVNHTSWVAVVTPTDRPKSVRNRCLIELFCGVAYVVALPFWHFCWCRGICHRTGSDLLLFVCITMILKSDLHKICNVKYATCPIIEQPAYIVHKQSTFQYDIRFSPCLCTTQDFEWRQKYSTYFNIQCTLYFMCRNRFNLF